MGTAFRHGGLFSDLCFGFMGQRVWVQRWGVSTMVVFLGLVNS